MSEVFSQQLKNSRGSSAVCGRSAYILDMSSPHLITDLNDFITPSQICIKPVPSKDETMGVGEVIFNGTGNDVSADPVTISLNDCLACSGCITSAESILVNQQTYQQVYRVLDTNLEAMRSGTFKPKITVFSLSIQTLTALSVKFGCSIAETTPRVYHFLKHIMGVDYVFDTLLARDISLYACGVEFCQHQSETNACAPLMTGSCPGWVCYVEKTQESIIPHLSRVKSPQQIMGTLVKHFIFASQGVVPGQIFHVTVMPCYDKKLEASRSDFFDENSQAREVDCVITTGELGRMMEERLGGMDNFMKLPSAAVGTVLDPKLSLLSESGLELLSHSGEGAGGYMEFVLRFAAKTMFNIEIDKNLAVADASRYELLIATQRNSDYRDFILKRRDDGQVLLRFAQVYGFRNVQTLVRKLRGGRVRYDYVEVMACPGACLNGGGQKIEGQFGTNLSPYQNLQAMNSAYKRLQTVEPLALQKTEVIIREWLGGPSSPLLVTSFRGLAPEENAANSRISVQW